MPTVTEEVLQRLFASCGKIETVQIRCSQGRAIVAGLPLKEYYSTDRMYATVAFSTPSAARKALKFNRCILHQVQIVACCLIQSIYTLVLIVVCRLASMLAISLK
jgi:hypothetical protein